MKNIAPNSVTECDFEDSHAKAMTSKPASNTRAKPISVVRLGARLVESAPLSPLHGVSGAGQKQTVVEWKFIGMKVGSTNMTGTL